MGKLPATITLHAQPLAMVPRGPHAGVHSEDRRIVCQPQPPVAYGHDPFPGSGVVRLAADPP